MMGGSYNVRTPRPLGVEPFGGREAGDGPGLDLGAIAGRLPDPSLAPAVLASSGNRGRRTDSRFSTPLPPAATIAGGSASLTIDGVRVIILPDRRSSSRRLSGRAETTFALSGAEVRHQVMGDKVTSITAPRPTITIQTTFGPGASPEMPSAYGAGRTLREHEASHGADYLRFLETSEFPVFGGATAKTRAEISTALAAYQLATRNYCDRMEAYSRQRTDCTGPTRAGFCR